MGYVPYTALAPCNFGPTNGLRDSDSPGRNDTMQWQLGSPRSSTKIEGSPNNQHKRESRRQFKASPDNQQDIHAPSLLFRQFMAHPLVKRDSIKRANSVPIPPPMPLSLPVERPPPPPPPPQSHMPKIQEVNNRGNPIIQKL